MKHISYLLAYWEDRLKSSKGWTLQSYITLQGSGAMQREEIQHQVETMSAWWYYNLLLLAFPRPLWLFSHSYLLSLWVLLSVSLSLPRSVVLYVSLIHMPMCVLSCSVVSNSLWPMEYSMPGPLPMGFSGQEYWSGLPCPPPGDLPDPRTELASLMSSALAASSLPLAPRGKPSHAPHTHTHIY